MRNHPPSSTLHPRRILVRGVNWLGDAIMSTPALLRLREQFPGAHITLLAPEKLRELWLRHPAIDEVIAFEPGESVWTVASQLKYRPASETLSEVQQHVVEARQNLQTMDLSCVLDSAKGVLSSAASVARPRFDLALVLPNSPRSAVEVWLANIPRRIGYARPWRNCFLTQTIAPRARAVEMHKRSVAEIKALIAEAHPDHGSRTTHHASRITYPPSAHHLHQYLHLVAALGASPEPLAPRLVVTPEETVAVAKKFGLDTASTGGRPLLGLNPGAEYGPAKRWPIERFVAAARELQQRTHCLWLIVGGKGDLALAEQVASALHASRFTFHDLCGKTSLRELMALLKSCRVLLTNDTGPMHVAAAVGTTVVVPFGSTSPQLTGPGLPADPCHRLLKSEVPCSPCFLRECPIDFRCMNGIRVERVVAEAMKALNR